MLCHPSFFNLLQQFLRICHLRSVLCAKESARGTIWMCGRKLKLTLIQSILSHLLTYFVGTGGWRWGCLCFGVFLFPFFGGWGGDVKKRLLPLEVNSLGHCVMKRKHWVHKNGWDVAIIVRGSSECPWVFISKGQINYFNQYYVDGR